MQLTIQQLIILIFTGITLSLLFYFGFHIREETTMDQDVYCRNTIQQQVYLQAIDEREEINLPCVTTYVEEATNEDITTQEERCRFMFQPAHEKRLSKQDGTYCFVCSVMNLSEPYTLTVEDKSASYLEGNTLGVLFVQTADDNWLTDLTQNKGMLAIGGGVGGVATAGMTAFILTPPGLVVATGTILAGAAGAVGGYFYATYNQFFSTTATSPADGFIITVPYTEETIKNTLGCTLA